MTEPEPSAVDTDELGAELDAAGPWLVQALAPQTPPAPLLDRVLERAATGGRLERFASSVAGLLELTSSEAVRLLDALDSPEAWRPSRLPGAEVQSVRSPGPEGFAVFLRLRAGLTFPEHEHVGHEQVLILAGRCQDGDQVYGPSELVEMTSGTSHSFTVCPGPDFVALVVVERGVKFGKALLTSF
jgi:anti-sigma factor ChrR (cupin superfamily)